MSWGLSEPFQGMGWGQGHIVKIILAHRGNSTLITGREGERERERERVLDLLKISFHPPPKSLPMITYKGPVYRYEG